MLDSDRSLMSEGSESAYRVYSVIPRKGKEDWFEIGIACPHPDGEGFSIDLQAQPLNGKLVLRSLGKNPPQLNDEQRVSLAQQVDAYERAIIERCLVEAGGKVNLVMKRLNVPRRTLSEKMTR